MRTNSYIVLPDEIREEEQSISVSKSITVSTAFNKKGSRNPLFSMFLNRLKNSFSYRRSDQKTVTSPYSFGENYNIKSDFDLSVKKVPTLPIFFWLKPIPIIKKLANTRLSLYPDRWTTSANYSRNLTVTDDISFNRRSSIKRDFVGSTDLSYKIFNNLTTTYHYDTRRDLSNLDDVNITLNSDNFKLGLETHYGQRFGAGYDPKLLSFLSTAFSFKSTYTDDWERTNKNRRSAMSRSYNVNGKFDHISFLGGKSSGRNRSTRGGSSRRGRGRPQAKEGEEKKPLYDKPLSVLRALTGWIDPISYSYGKTYNNSLPGMLERPDWVYLFGFRDDPDVPLTADVRSQTASEGETYDFSSGFTFMGGLVTNAKFKRSITRDLIKQGSLYENTSTNWPDLSIRINKFRYFPLLKTYINKFIDVFDPRTGFNKQTKETKDITNGYVTSKNVTITHNPLLSISFKVFRSLSMSASYTYTSNKKEVFNPTNGKIQSETNSFKKSFALTAKYAFSSPHGITIPLFGKLKFQSTVDLSLTVKVNSSNTETSSNGGEFRPSEDKSDLTVVPVMSYTFSQQIKGGLTMTWQDTKDNYRNRKNHSREVKIWTEIRF